MSAATTANPPVIQTRALLDALEEGRPIAREAEALHLMQLPASSQDVQRLRQIANACALSQARGQAGYTRSMSLFLTNLCELQPRLYPYPRRPGDAQTWTLSIDDIDAALEEACARQFDQVFLSGGGYWPYLQVPGLEAASTLKSYQRVMAYVFERAQGLRLSALSPDEVDFLTVVSDRSAAYVLELLRDHGVSALGGLGVDVLDDRVRMANAPKKPKVKRWFEIVETAWRLGMPVRAALEAGPWDTPAQRTAHLFRLRAFLQRCPGAFDEFSPRFWTRSAHQSCPPEACAGLSAMAVTDRHAQLSLLAVARLVLGDVLPVQQTLWLPTAHSEKTLEQAQEGLRWGASGLGGTDALAYAAFLSGGREPVSFAPSDLDALIQDTAGWTAPSAALPS